jgi:putative ATP-dependent endonuclease of OLD family
MLTQRSNAPPAVTAPSAEPRLTPADRQDLERYLDATKSNLLFARRVMLVEGAAELLLIPILAQRVLGLDLEREGITLVAIHGAHFGPFARLFSDRCMPKRCAIVADADGPAVAPLPGDDVPEPHNLLQLRGPYVEVFLGQTTFERELVLQPNLAMLAATARDLGAPSIQQDLERASLPGAQVTEELRAKVLRTAIRFGKARFAQVASRHIQPGNTIPLYIQQAIQWLRAP